MHDPDDSDRFDDEVRAAYRTGDDTQEQQRRVIERLREPAPPANSSRGLGWWLRPGALALRPVLAVTLLATSFAAGLLVRGAARAPGDLDRALVGGAAGDRPGAAEARPGDPAPVTFAFRAPGATRVAVVGDFNGWDPDATPLRRAALSELWMAEVPVGRGLHAYAFVIDGGEWQPDPAAPLAPERTFGSRHSLLVVDEAGPL